MLDQFEVLLLSRFYDGLILPLDDLFLIFRLRCIDFYFNFFLVFWDVGNVWFALV